MQMPPSHLRLCAAILLIALCVYVPPSSATEPVLPVDRVYQEVQQADESRQETEVALNRGILSGTGLIRKPS